MLGTESTVSKSTSPDVSRLRLRDDMSSLDSERQLDGDGDDATVNVNTAGLPAAITGIDEFETESTACSGCDLASVICELGLGIVRALLESSLAPERVN